MEIQLTFEHSDIGTEEFRIIELLPGNHIDEEIRCVSHIFSLAEVPEYETVSYVWGDPAITKSVLLDGRSLQVTTNLEKALRYIRNTESRFLWVDAICINQVDNLEKGHQINLMGNLYRNAKRCLIWLGDLQSLGINKEQSEKFIDLLEMVANGEHEDENCFKDSAVWDPAFKALHSFMTCAWWWRIWTVQEAVLPPAGLVIWETFSIPWETLEKAHYGWISNYYEVSKFASCAINLFTSRIAGIIFIKQDPCMEPASCLWRFRQRHATNPRDMVLGLLGILPGWSLGLDPEHYYGLETAQLYENTAIALIKHSKSLLPMIGRRGELPTHSNIASWATDWVEPPTMKDSDQPLYRNRWWSHESRWCFFHADRDKEAFIEVDPEHGIITLEGVFVDTIIAVGEPLIPIDNSRGLSNLSRERRSKAIRDWFKLGKKYRPREGSYMSGGPYISGGTWDDAFWRTMLGDVMVTYASGVDVPSRMAHTGDGIVFKDCFNSSFSNSTEIEMSIEDHVINQVFFVTSKGYIGVGPCTLRVNDGVWVLYGGRVPFALRKIDEDGPADFEDVKRQKFHHISIGDVYVHGIMQGEAMDGHEERRERVVLH